MTDPWKPARTINWPDGQKRYTPLSVIEIHSDDSVTAQRLVDELDGVIANSTDGPITLAIVRMSEPILECRHDKGYGDSDLVVHATECAISRHVFDRIRQASRGESVPETETLPSCTDDLRLDDVPASIYDLGAAWDHEPMDISARKVNQMIGWEP